MYGRRIEKLRQIAGLSANALAKKAGVAQSTLSEVEAGKYLPKLDFLEKVCDALGYSLSEFFSLDKSENLSPELKVIVNTFKILTPRQIQILTVFLNDWIEQTHSVNNELKFSSTNPIFKNNSLQQIDLLDVFGRKDTVLTAAGVALSLQDRVDILEFIREKLPQDETHDSEDTEVIAASYDSNYFAHIPTPEEAADIRLAIQAAEQERAQLQKKNRNKNEKDK